MAEYTLIPAPPLAGIDETIGTIALRAPADLAIVALALPLGSEEAALAAVSAAFAAGLPEPGKSVLSKDDSRLVRLAPDQAFILFTWAGPDAERYLAERLGDAVYLTDQTDTWCSLEVEGIDSRAALERICPVDLHPLAFAEGDAARTVMEHMGVLVLRTGPDRFLLLSAGSSAGSFLHAVRRSAENIA